MTNQDEKKNHWWPFIVFLVIIFIFGMINPTYLLFDQAYTVGKYSGKTMGSGRTGSSWIFNYEVRNKKYKLTYKGAGIPIQNVFIKFYPPNPEKSIFYWDKKVPPCEIEYKIPPEGWKKLPKDLCN